MHSLGHTRSANQRDHVLSTPDTFVRTPLPGIQRGTAIVHVSPALGAGFTQYTADLEPGGTMGPVTAQRFVFVLSGSIRLNAPNEANLDAGGYTYIPEDFDCSIEAREESRLAVIEKPYWPITTAKAPEFLIANEASIAAAALNDDDDLQVRVLLPDDPAFDFAVNTMTYQPGASLSQVEVHVMEHGLLMLEGGGIYRLGEHWYPVAAGDFIWMAPYCPQWFAAIGKQPAKYLIYKDWNRHPLP